MGGLGEEVARVDGALVALARGESGLRLRLGQALEVLSRGGVFELGFSSPSAYAVERCERSGRWAEVARCMARRLERLPGLRRGVALGQVSWSMAELLVRVAQPENEARWVEMAESRTVRQMRVYVAAALAWERAVGAGGEGAHQSVSGSAASGSATSGSDVPGSGVFDSGALDFGAFEKTSGADTSGEGSFEGHAAGGRTATAAWFETAPLTEGEDAWGEASEGDLCTLTCAVDQEEAWLFEATRSLLDQLGVHGGEAQSEALLAEAQGALQVLLPEGTLDSSQWQEAVLARQRRVSELARWRVEAEALCEMNDACWLRVPRGGQARGAAVDHGATARAAALGMASLEGLSHQRLDALVRALREAMARHELELSRLVLLFHRAGGWRRLGFASEAQYARERLGASRSSVFAWRRLALRLEELPEVAAALGAGQLGVEAALQVVRVATVATQAAWVARARRRTIKHLREEVAAALAAVRWSGELNCPPPAEAELEAFQALERAVVSGRLPPVQASGGSSGGAASSGGARWGGGRMGPASEPLSEERRAWFVMLASLAAWLEGGLQMSAGGAFAARSRAAKAGRVGLRLRMSRGTSLWWHGLEAQARRWLPRGMSWLRFVCLSLWQAWQHAIGTDVAYAHIYIRDRFRCVSPVCNRRDVTPHHLRFRSAGGSDEPDNIGSFCSWCHLFGVHGGRIRARGTAQLIHWELGAPGSPCLVVHGRERVAA